MRGKTGKPNDFEILAFPSNVFLHQEPGSNATIAKFAHEHGAGDWVFFEKTNVKGYGPETNPVYRFCKHYLPGEISWNFNKFLIDRHGVPVKRYTLMDSHKQIRADIEKLLDAPKSAEGGLIPEKVLDAPKKEDERPVTTIDELLDAPKSEDGKAKM